jgi:hypothetical protein
MSDDLRASLEAAVAKSESLSPPASAPPVNEAASTGTDLSTTTDSSATKEVISSESSSSDTPAPDQSRGRDEKGRFASKTSAIAPEQAKPAPRPEDRDYPPAPPIPPPTKVPQSLRPEEREQWGKVPEIMQRAFIRREAEIQARFREADQHRKLVQAFNETVQPFEAFLRSGGSNPLKALDSALRTAYTLRMAPPQEKAVAVAQLIRQHQIPVEALAAALDGAPVPTSSQAPVYDPRVDHLIQQFQSREQQQQEALLSRARSDISSFSQNHEFFEDVQEVMSQLISSGVAKDLESAYDLACYRDPEIRKLRSQRQQAEGAATANAATQAAQTAGSSVRPNPVGSGPGTNGSDIRSSLEAAFKQASRR